VGGGAALRGTDVFMAIDACCLLIDVFVIPFPRRDPIRIHISPRYGSLALLIGKDERKKNKEDPDFFL
jgi:hypothetical protein